MIFIQILLEIPEIISWILLFINFAETELINLLHPKYQKNFDFINLVIQVILDLKFLSQTLAIIILFFIFKFFLAIKKFSNSFIISNINFLELQITMVSFK